MSGYLERLAARALGTERPIRPVVPARFVPEPTRGDAPANPFDDFEVEIEAAHPEPPESSPRPARQSVRAHAPTQNARSLEDVPEEAPDLEPPPAPTIQPRRARGPHPAVDDPFAAPIAPISAAPAPDPTPAGITRQALAPNQEETPPAQAFRAHEPANAHAPVPVTIQHPAPPRERTLPSEPAPGRQAFRQSRDLPGLSQVPQPTIEVSIGRIEVRAVSTSPPRPARTPVAPAPALSLDDYLRTRGEGSR